MDGTVIAAIITSAASLWIAVAGWSASSELARQQREAEGRAQEQARQLEALRAELERRNEEARERRARQDVVARFREPLARSAHDLQRRIENVLVWRFFEAYGGPGADPRRRAYVIDHTLFLVAQLFAWIEIVRREIDFIDLESETRTRELSACLARLSLIWGSDYDGAGTTLMVWAGEQRQIGEGLIERTERGRECIGYGAFLAHAAAVAPEHPLPALRAEIERMMPAPTEAGALRLRQLQHQILDLLDLLDPDCVRFPREHRQKV